MSWAWLQIFCTTPPWEGCCLEHDHAYWKGGERNLRLIADTELMRAVAANGHPYWAVIMFVSVRIGGVSWLPFPSVRKVSGKWRFAFDGVRWGYGYRYPRYK